MELLTYFAATGSDQTLIDALGIDWKMLILQIIAFLLLTWFAGRFIFPPLIRTIDKRQANIEESQKAAAESQKQADAAKSDIEKMLKEARAEAKDIVATAKKEATAEVEAAEQKATDRADKIVADAREQLSKDVIAAKKSLHNETIELVALATEKVVAKKMSDSLDNASIAQALEEVR